MNPSRQRLQWNIFKLSFKIKASRALLKPFMPDWFETFEKALMYFISFFFYVGCALFLLGLIDEHSTWLFKAMYGLYHGLEQLFTPLPAILMGCFFMNVLLNVRRMSQDPGSVSLLHAAIILSREFLTQRWVNSEKSSLIKVMGLIRENKSELVQGQIDDFTRQLEAQQLALIVHQHQREPAPSKRQHL